MAKDLPRNRKQGTEIEATGEEAAAFRHLAKVSRLMSVISLSFLKGSAIQR